MIALPLMWSAKTLAAKFTRSASISGSTGDYLVPRRPARPATTYMRVGIAPSRLELIFVKDASPPFHPDPKS